VGAFKIRGAWHRLSDMDEAERARGVVGVSSGNHAQGVAWAARRLGIKATIVMPVDAPKVKVAATRSHGAEVVFYDRPSGEDRDAVAQRLIDATGATLVHAYGDPWVIEGQGSAGLEIAAQMQARGAGAPTRIVACCGGGGLTAGLALACPEAEIVPVEPEGWDDVARSLASGTIQRVAPDALPTACDALQTPATWPINFAILEPGGAAALAAVLAGKVPVDGRTAVLLTGSNTDPADFAAVIAGQD
jgi:threonine dehydratase